MELKNLSKFKLRHHPIRRSRENSSFLDSAFECGFYDHSHLTNEIKRKTGLLPPPF